MAKDAQVLLLDDKTDLSALARREWENYRAVICLFWIAPSTQAQLSDRAAAPCFGLADIIDNDLVEWGRETYNQVSRIVQDGPRYGDFYCRAYLMEKLYHEWLAVELLKRTIDFVECLRQQWNVPAIRIQGNLPPKAEMLLPALLGSKVGLSYQPIDTREHPATERASLGRALQKRLSEVMLTGNKKMFIGDVVSWLDKTYYWHCQFGHWLPRKLPSPENITFFSSYLNNSRTLSSFVDLMPQPVQWVLTNESARQGVPAGTGYVWLWQFSDRALPHQDEFQPETSVLVPSTSVSPPLLQAWLAHSEAWESWQKVEFALLTNLTRCWEAYLDQTRPRLIVTANQWGIEGWFTQIARARGIPVLQLMHGAVGDYLHTKTPVVSDKLIVWGDFWRDLWPEEERSRILVYNPGQRFAPVERKPDRPRPCITFFSWPLDEVAYYNQSELLDGLIHLFNRLLASRDCDLIVRFHPRENPASFIQRWQRLYGAIPDNVLLNKNEPLADVLAQTDVAIMFHSTVMLNCLSSNIPVIIPGWTDFGWNQALENVDGIHLARDWENLEACLNAWLEQPPQFPAETFQHFISPAGLNEAKFRELTQHLLTTAQSHHSHR